MYKSQGKTRLTLRDPTARKTLTSAIKVLEGLGIPLSECMLGGGTAVDARLRHRQSKDIDLSVTAQTYASLYARLGSRGIKDALTAAGAAPRSAHGIGATWRYPLEVAHKGSRVEVRFGYTSLYGHDLLDGVSPGPEVEAEHDIPLAPMWWILRGKIKGRAIDGGTILPRDFHDLLVCARQNPESAIRAMREIPLEERAETAAFIRERLAEDPQWNGTRTRERDQLIVAPRHTDLVGPALWQEATRFLDEGPDAYVEKLAARHRSSSQRGC